MKINYTLNDLGDVAKQIIETVNSKIILLYGEMGAGKTTLAKALVEAIGSNDEVSSPTFSIVNEYITNLGETIYHFDLYRVEDVEELYNIGIEDYLYSNNWMIIEWPEIIIDLLPSDVNSIHLEYSLNESRALKLKNKNLTY